MFGLAFVMPEELRLRVVPLASREAMELGLYWFRDGDLLEPVDWDYVKTLPVRVRAALEAYMRGEVSIGKAAEISGLGLRRFEEIRARARIPIRAPRLPEDFKRELASLEEVLSEPPSVEITLEEFHSFRRELSKRAET